MTFAVGINQGSLTRNLSPTSGASARVELKPNLEDVSM